MGSWVEQIEEFFKKHPRCYEVVFEEDSKHKNRSIVVPMEATLPGAPRVEGVCGEEYCRVRRFSPISKTQVIQRIKKHEFVDINVSRSCFVNVDMATSKDKSSYIKIDFSNRLYLGGFDKLDPETIADIVKKHGKVRYCSKLNRSYDYEKKKYMLTMFERKYQRILKFDVKIDNCKLKYVKGSYRRTTRLQKQRSLPVTPQGTYRITFLSTLIHGTLRYEIEKKFGGRDLLKYFPTNSRGGCLSHIINLLAVLKGINCRTYTKSRDWKRFCEYYQTAFEAECKIIKCDPKEYPKKVRQSGFLSLASYELFKLKKFITRSEKCQKTTSAIHQIKISGGSSRSRAAPTSGSRTARSSP